MILSSNIEPCLGDPAGREKYRFGRSIDLSLACRSWAMALTSFGSPEVTVTVLDESIPRKSQSRYVSRISCKCSSFERSPIAQGAGSESSSRSARTNGCKLTTWITRYLDGKVYNLDLAGVRNSTGDHHISFAARAGSIPPRAA